MNLHEYQSKELMRLAGAPVLKGILCTSAEQAEAAARALGAGVCVVKAQVHAGGRGKAGGVSVVQSPAQAREAAHKMIGMTLVTPQTGPRGKLVRKVYVEALCSIAKEYYLSLMLDRARRCIAVVASAAGGMDIEEVARAAPGQIMSVPIDARVGCQPFYGTTLGFNLGLDRERALALSALLQKLYRLMIGKDLTLLEINPLVLTSEGGFVVLDAKCTVDDNALFRQPELKALFDRDEIDAKDLRASQLGLSYIALDGDIGCMVNGAGLAMATMDIIKAFGGEPANFLDVGGGASKETVREAFKILLSDFRVKGILVNIFGGIMKCDVIASGIVEAAREPALKAPLVVRLQGTNVELGREILARSGLRIISADGMDDAGRKIVEAVRA